MIKTTHNDKMVYTELCSHPLLCTPFHSHSPSLHSHSLPSTPTHFYLFLTHSYSFPAFFHPLPLMFSSLLLILNPHRPCADSLTHFQSISKYSHPIESITYHYNPNLVPLFTCVRALHTCVYVLLCFTCPCTYAIHFYAICYVYILSMPLRVLISRDYLLTLRYFKTYL